MSGLDGEAAAGLEQAFRSPGDDPRRATGLLCGSMVLPSATAVSRAVRRLCERSRPAFRQGT
ncbi:hypothetical protein ACFT0E_31865, partial [Streptomyces sp. NPDC057052]